MIFFYSEGQDASQYIATNIITWSSLSINEVSFINFDIIPCYVLFDSKFSFQRRIWEGI